MEPIQRTGHSIGIYRLTQGLILTFFDILLRKFVRKLQNSPLDKIQK